MKGTVVTTLVQFMNGSCSKNSVSETGWLFTKHKAWVSGFLQSELRGVPRYALGHDCYHPRWKATESVIMMSMGSPPISSSVVPKTVDHRIRSIQRGSLVSAKMALVRNSSVHVVFSFVGTA